MTRRLAMGVGLICVTVSGCFDDGVAHERAEAVKAGVARWTVDEKTGKTKFVYGRAGDGN